MDDNSRILDLITVLSLILGVENNLLQITVPFTPGSSKRERQIICTPDHKFYSSNSHYVRAGDLKTGDIVYAPCFTYLQDEVLEFLYGNILGDGHLYKESDMVRFAFGQGEAHKEYVDALYRMYSGTGYFSEPNGFNKEKTNYKFSLSNTGLLTTSINEDKIFNGKKWSLNKTFLGKLTWKSLAMWYCDDGSYHKKDQVAFLHTESYTLAENEMLVKMLGERFGIQATIQGLNSKYQYLRINKESSKEFLKNVASYIPNCLKYKLPEELQGIECKLYTTIFTQGMRLIPMQIKNIKLYVKKKGVYDIEVADNHNFFAGGVLTHNCQNMPQLFREGSEERKHTYTATEKLDGSSSTFTAKKIGKKKFEYYICSRNMVCNENDSSNMWVEMSKQYDMKNVCINILKNNTNLSYVNIQGETYGTVQKRKYDNKNRMAVFNLIFGYNDGKVERLNPVNMTKFFKDNYPNIECVPIVEENIELPATCEDILKMAGGPSAIDGGMREGLVFRSEDGKISFKAVDNEYLAKFH